MCFMRLEFEIARRMARSSSGGRRSVMERIAIFSVALSLTVMLLSMAVIQGFKVELKRKLGDLTSHIVVSDVRSTRGLEGAPIRATEQLEATIRSIDGFQRMARYAQRGGIVRTADAVEGILLKGVDGAYDFTALGGWLQAGEIPRVGDEIRTKDLLLSTRLAERLQVGVGDRIEILFVGEGSAPFRDRFKVSGLYASGIDELDNRLVFTDLRNVQRLSQLNDDELTGYEIFIRELDEAPRVAAGLDRCLLYDESDAWSNLTAQSVQERYPHLFDWLKAHDVNAVVILTIMLIVAFFNMAAALLILVLERIRTIGILKALGMQHRALRRIFLYRAGGIALRGLLWGNLVSSVICWVQATFAPLKLDPEGYLLSEVPIAVSSSWWVVLNIGFTVAILVLMLLPASVVSTVKPDETMRYE